AEAIAEDKVNRALDVFPQSQGRQQVWAANCVRTVEHRVQDGQPQDVGLAASQERARQPRLALGQRFVDLVPDGPGVGIKPDPLNLASKGNGVRQPWLYRVQDVDVGAAALRQHFGALDANPQETVGKAVGRLRCAEIAAQFFAGDVADDADVSTRGANGVVFH